jgi:hypothetical protein
MRMLLVVMLVGVAALLVTVAAFRRTRAGSERPIQLLSIAALGSTVVIGLAAIPALVEDRGGLVGILATVAPPILITGLAALALRLLRGPARLVAAWVAAALMLAFVIVYGLGLGFYYWPSAMLVFATASVINRAPPDPARTDRARVNRPAR